MRVLRGLLALLFPLVLGAQQEVTYTVIMHPALDSVRTAPARGDEVAWCVGYYTKNRVSTRDLIRADTVIRVYTVTRAVTSHADRTGGDFFCPMGTPMIHSHPADDDGRVACDASRIDHHTASAKQMPFAVVWCASPGTVTYRGWNVKTPDSARQDSLVGQGRSYGPTSSLPRGPVPRSR